MGIAIELIESCREDAIDEMIADNYPDICPICGGKVVEEEYNKYYCDSCKIELYTCWFCGDLTEEIPDDEGIVLCNQCK